MRLTHSELLLVAICFPAALFLFVFVEWSTHRVVQRVWDESLNEAVPSWTTGRIAGYAVLIIFSLLAFPMAAYSLWVAFFMPPWWILLPCAAGFTLDGLAGLTLAGGLLAEPRKRGAILIVTGIGSILLLAAALTRLLNRPH